MCTNQQILKFGLYGVEQGMSSIQVIGLLSMVFEVA